MGDSASHIHLNEDNSLVKMSQAALREISEHSTKLIGARIEHRRKEDSKIQVGHIGFIVRDRQPLATRTQ